MEKSSEGDGQKWLFKGIDDMDKLVTFFTPTYNRAHILHRCYESLCGQTSYNFKWLVVDDGSKDGTEKIIQKWISQEHRFPIEYHYKENGGSYKMG